MGVEIAERIVQKGGSPLRVFLWILPNPYKMPGPEPTGFILFWVDFSIIFKSFNSLSSEVILYSRLTMWSIALPTGIASLENLVLLLRISSVALVIRTLI